MINKTIVDIIASRVGIPAKCVLGVLELLEEGATVPFIARYRKERTGNLDEVQIAAIMDVSDKLQELAARKETIIKTIEEQGKMTDELRKQIDDCWESNTLEDLYLPYKPHRKTRADMAREKGLEPLAKKLMSQHSGENPSAIAKAYANGISIEEALQGARDIIAEWINESQHARNAVRREFDYSAMLTSKVVKSKAGEDEALQYKDYFEAKDRLSRVQSHRYLAMRRGEAAGYLKVDISPDAEKALDKLARLFLKNQSDSAYQVEMAMEDAYKRLLKPSIETEYASKAKEKADEEAIRVFADNVRQLLLGAPLGQQRVLAIDPGFRTGCKVVCLSEHGDLLCHSVIYPTAPKNDTAGATKELKQLIERYAPQAISIGNGTASRETETFVKRALSGLGYDIEVYVVSENGASVYSASTVAREEFPDEDVTVRGAVSIGRRLMDPLAELVKIDPKSIGVGQYQHDVDQTKLKNALTMTVESVVNKVGVDVNTASKHLLTYISGLGPALAQNIVDYRSKNGAFRSRKELLKVPKLGAKTFEQAAGFLRVTGGDNPLDNTAVHPESYGVVEAMAKEVGCSVEMLLQDADKRAQVHAEAYISKDGGWDGKAILRELEKPSRDPRGKAEVFAFDENVHSIEDLREGMVLPGIVTNMTAFGAFVDVGVHQDGLVHISKLRGRTLHIQEKIRVTVMEVDLKRRRISLGL